MNRHRVCHHKTPQPVVDRLAVFAQHRPQYHKPRLKALTGSLVYWGAEVGGLVVVPDATDGRWVNVIRPAHWGRPAPPPYIVIPSRIRRISTEYSP